MHKWLTVLAIALLSGCESRSLVGRDPGRADERPPYLALGDSIAFGENPTVQDRSNDGVFIGYPAVIAEQLGYALTDAACNGETSGSFLSPDAPDNGCRNYHQNHPLHVDYDGTQMDFAIGFLADHPETALVTIDLGGNDLLLMQKSCQQDAACEAANLLPAAAQYRVNLDTILSQLRDDAGYGGPILLVNIYSKNYLDLVQTAAILTFNHEARQAADAVGAELSNSFMTFAVASVQSRGNPCQAGLLIPLGDGTCDIHPSPAGRDLLGSAAVNVLAGGDDGAE
jgi:lysophospholipase L1-like esterase